MDKLPELRWIITGAGTRQPEAFSELPSGRFGESHEIAHGAVFPVCHDSS